MRSFSPLMAARALWQMRVKGRPFVLSHGINSRCNLRCSFCEYWKHPEQEMSTPEILAMLDDARSFGIGVYNAWTVEPLLRSDLPQILCYARSLGMVTSLITNGQLLRQRAKDLSCLDYLSVSVDGINSYERLRGADLAATLDGIREAIGEGHEVLINCVVCSKNLDELEDLVHLAESIGAWISFEPLHESEGIGKEIWDDLGIRDLPRYVKAVSRLMEMKKTGAPIINSQTYLAMMRSLKPRFNCHASDIILHVATDGTIENCRIHREPLGRVSDGLAAVWESSRNRRKELIQGCRGCLFFGYVENSLLYEFVPEVMAHYEWM